MRSVKFFVAAGAASLLSSMALAADMPAIMPPADVLCAAAGRGLRRMVSARRYRFQQPARRQASQDQRCAPTDLTSFQQTGQVSTPAASYGLGAGYQFNNWFRADVTGEYRGNSNFIGTRPHHRRPGGLSAPTPTTPASPNGSSSPTPMSISAPGGA